MDGELQFTKHITKRFSKETTGPPTVMHMTHCFFPQSIVFRNSERI
jgi:hypothetical protein